MPIMHVIIIMGNPNLHRATEKHAELSFSLCNKPYDHSKVFFIEPTIRCLLSDELHRLTGELERIRQEFLIGSMTTGRQLGELPAFQQQVKPTVTERALLGPLS